MLVLSTHEEKGKIKVGKRGPSENKLNSVVDEFNLSDTELIIGSL